MGIFMSIQYPHSVGKVHKILQLVEKRRNARSNCVCQQKSERGLKAYNGLGSSIQEFFNRLKYCATSRKHSYPQFETSFQHGCLLEAGKYSCFVLYIIGRFYLAPIKCD